ncbi:homocysteine S-methyltransferase family protein [Hyphomicrobium sp. CS1GBMeth3]|uniref:homocysteine S-methyltransferase family protein n=1 Tax=Hyphomicrobium sp. CS1GBMeth3 TaxID=1892845 RepID=UPI000930C05D|nr:homocysteine S-methyltransferase family protein [Hyphomicrobium sp. CS1GBMeth3]
MTKYRHQLPQLSGGIFLSDGGLETTLIYHEGIELPHFAAFDLLRTQEGRETLRRYYVPYIETARRNGFGFVLDSPTWRANPDWGRKLGYSAAALAAGNREAISLMAELRAAHETRDFPMVVSGAIGPRGDGYIAGQVMDAADAEAYHREQIRVFAESGADMVSAYTLTNVNEAVGIARAARSLSIPVAISFTLETDGMLPTGETLAHAIEAVDAATNGGPTYYMINCAHPTHFENSLAQGGSWISRLKGLRANASRRSHAELDAATELDAGNPDELGRQYRALRQRFPHLSVLGGCCGTDHRHVACIGASCKKAA